MSHSRSRNNANSSRRDFLKTAAGVAAGAAFTRIPLRAQGARGTHPFPGIDPKLLMTPDLAWEWAAFKAQGGPTYAGSAGWKRFNDFLVAKAQTFGLVDIVSVDVSYDRYVVDDWPDRRTHIYNSGIAVEKLVTDGTPVPVVASYGMTSGSTPPEGITAPMVFYDPATPPTEAQIAGKILVFATAKYPEPPYTNNFFGTATLTDYQWRSPGKWHPLFTPPPHSVTNSFHSRWAWGQVGRFAQIGLKAKAAGIVVVYDLSPGAALGLTQRSVYTADGNAGPASSYINCPTLTLDRVNGAKVLTDAKAGRTATLTLIARFETVTARSPIGFLPGKNYGTAADEQVLVAAHTDSMSLVQDNGGLGILGILSYFNQIPRAQRARTIGVYFDCRHFMPGGEADWMQYDYYHNHKDKLKPIVATVGLEHMGGRETIEVGPGGNEYTYSKERPEDGGVITSLMDVNNNNIWLIEAIAKAATDNKWPRVDAKARGSETGVNGGYQGGVRSAVNKGREYGIPGLGLAGDWPGAWTQTYAQLDTEAGPAGFDKNYFVQQVAGMTQLTGELMMVKPVVIDFGWGDLHTALNKVPDSGFVNASNATTQRKDLINQYVGAFRKVEAGTFDEARRTLNDLNASISSSVVPGDQPALKTLVDGQIAKLSSQKV